LRESYSLLSTCRYISDPMSYASDYTAIEDAQTFLKLFGFHIHDMQVRLLDVRVIVDNILMGSESIGVGMAVEFFTHMGTIPALVQEVSQKASEPSLSAV